MLQYGDFIEVDYCVQFVGYGDDGVTAEFLAHDALDHGVGDVVHAEGMEVVSEVVWDWVERGGEGRGGRGRWNSKESRRKRGKG